MASTVSLLLFTSNREAQHDRDSRPTLPMASSSSRLALVLSAAMAMAMAVAFLHLGPASAEYYLVGDEAGWTLNYTIGWPENKTFKVDDFLVFRYPRGEYTVTEVDSQTFRECYRQGNAVHEWTSGNDTVRLDTPGRRWFFSSLDDHCDMGLKLFVDVVGSAPAQHPLPPAQAPAPVTTTPPPNTTGRPVPQTQSPAAPSPLPSDKSSAAALDHYYKVDGAVARAAALAGAVVVALLM